MFSNGHFEIAAADIEWKAGSAPGIHYAMFLMEPANPQAPMVLLTRYDPGATVTPHTHASNYFEYIIEGEQTIGKKHFSTGDVRMVKGNTGYGPINVGPMGCTVVIMFQDGSLSATEHLPRRKPAVAA